MLNKRSKENLQQMGSLIDNENKGHISSNINEMVEYRVLRGRIYNVGFQPDERVIPFLELAGFGSAALIRTFDLRYDLISALVERWRPETHTFHLPCGEYTITLEDVAVQLGLPIDGNVVTGVSSISRPARLCYELLGHSPSEGKFATLRFSWLKANFEHLPNTATELEVMQAAQGYIMHLIGGVLVPNSHDSKVSLMYLPLLSNLHNTRSYNWGSTVLAMLYRELCRTTDPSAMDIGGCLILLQSWALYRMPFLIEHESGYREVIHGSDISSDDRESFWGGDYSVIPSHAYVYSNLWCISAPLIHFQTVEWYHGDRVLRQFGCIQYISTQPVRLPTKLHGMTRRGMHWADWGDVHEEYVTMWNNRFGRIPPMDRCLDLRPSTQSASCTSSETEPEPEPEAVPDPERRPEPELHSGTSSYHPDLGADDYFPGSSA
ncbi:serine/threonine-protein phosphatase 7 long form homolog [Gossypium hirsutum]|uniref:Serine/threonine-protein phosphatase 7 long form homolog n=1 Tax=Gossypium hirsutum TaxID=3635 RepID=A0A1U8PNA5_GOSHI|nr:serine/threonine-protein phosphatase 7 long form homolog [Gossypium hirsutum]